MATTVFWIAAGVLIALFVVWRLRRANQAVETILREERDREPAPDSSDEPVTHERGRHRKPE